MISVRRHYYGHEHVIAEPGAPTLNSTPSGEIRFRSRKTTITTTTGFTGSTTVHNSETTEMAARSEAGEEYEMLNFSEKSGF